MILTRLWSKFDHISQIGFHQWEPHDEEQEQGEHHVKQKLAPESEKTHIQSARNRLLAPFHAPSINHQRSLPTPAYLTGPPPQTTGTYQKNQMNIPKPREVKYLKF